MVKSTVLAAAGLIALAGTAPSQILFTENFEGGGVGVYTEVDITSTPTATLWHGDGLCDGVTPIPAVMGTNAASYNQGDIAIWNYSTGVANTGGIESPVIPSPASTFMTLAFDYLKQTEGGGSASFDQCFVETAPVAGVYSVLSQISGNSVCASSSVSLGPTGVGAGGWTHRFRFDTVDGIGNAYQGWTVDNVVSTAVPPPPPPFYAENFETGALGTYVETDPGGTPSATLWHGEALCDGVTPIPATMGTNAASYNQGDIAIWDYSTGGVNTGAIATPALATPGSLGVGIAFDYLKQTEGGGSGAFDQCFVEIGPSGGGFQTVAQVAGNSVCSSSAIIVAPTFVEGSPFQQRFRFDTVDAVGNAYQGWTVDNVALSGGTPGSIPGPSYCVVPAAPGFATISTSATAVLVHGPGVDDGTSAAVALPAAFSFFGVAKATFQVNSNGWLSFDSGFGPGFFGNAAIPSAPAPNDMVAGFWDDLHTGAAGSVYYDVTGGGDLIVEWNGMEQFPFNTSGENVTFQVVLHPSPANTVELRYDAASFASGPIIWSATIGVENVTGTVGKDATGGGAVNSAFPGSNLLLSPQGAGSFVPVPTGCGATTLTAAGTPRVGGFVGFTLGGVGGAPVMWIGLPFGPLPLCGPATCALGASLLVVLPGVTSVTGAIPCDPSLVGGVLAVQGADVFGLGGCGLVPFGVPFTTSNTIVMTIG
jgi:hypothetical protein